MATAADDTYTAASGATVYAGRPLPRPAWRQGMAQWEWKSITGSSMNGVDPTTITLPGGSNGPSSRINSWTGLVADPRSNIIYSPANGGHGDYDGNEVVAIDLSKNMPTWSIILDATPDADIQPDSKHYLDGRPPATHSYWHHHFLPSKNRIFRIGAGFVWGTPAGGNATSAFDVTAGDWDGAGTYPNTSYPDPSAITANGQAHDKATDNVYFFSTADSYATMRRFNAATNDFTNLAAMSGPGPGVAYYRPMVYDHTRGKAILIGDATTPANGGWVWSNDGSTGSWATITFTGDSVGTLGGASQNGAHFNEALDKIVVKTTSAGTILLVDPVTHVSTTQTTTGATVPGAVNGVNTRFLYLPNLGGYAYYPAYTDVVYFLATE